MVCIRVIHLVSVLSWRPHWLVHTLVDHHMTDEQKQAMHNLARDTATVMFETLVAIVEDDGEDMEARQQAKALLMVQAAKALARAKAQRQVAT